MKDITLLILAGGMGSRFGGLKQIEPFGPNQEFIIDYSIYDAKLAGFTKIVFLIKEENFEIFKETIGKRVEPHIKVEYCFQNMENVPLYYDELKQRTKPLGTAHAVLCCKDKINEPFAMINADDFYGRDAYIKAYDFLTNSSENEYGLIGYLAANTITDNGSVKRGICEEENGLLTGLTESVLEKTNNIYLASPLNGKTPYEIKKDNTVSMNFLLFKPSIFDIINSKFPKYLEENKDNLDKCEYLIPDVLFESIKEENKTAKVIQTSATWYGVTYKEDTPMVKEAIINMIENKEYKNKLWEE